MGTERDAGGRPNAPSRAAAALAGALAARTLLVLETASLDAAVLHTAAMAVPEGATIVGGKALWRWASSGTPSATLWTHVLFDGDRAMLSIPTDTLADFELFMGMDTRFSGVAADEPALPLLPPPLPRHDAMAAPLLGLGARDVAVTFCGAMPFGFATPTTVLVS